MLPLRPLEWNELTFPAELGEAGRNRKKVPCTIRRVATDVHDGSFTKFDRIVKFNSFEYTMYTLCTLLSNELMEIQTMSTRLRFSTIICVLSTKCSLLSRLQLRSGFQLSSQIIIKWMTLIHWSDDF